MTIVAGAVRVGLVDGELRINPNVKEVRKMPVVTINTIIALFSIYS